MGWHPLRARREKHDRELAEVAAIRAARRLLTEDLTVLGEQLEALGADADPPSTSEAQSARDGHLRAKAALAAATTMAELVAVEPILEESRYHLACAVARRDGLEMPSRREHCFFNPQHGPAVTDVRWTTQGQPERLVPACGSDAERLTKGEQPDVRLVRLGDRYVPWDVAGGSLLDVVHHQLGVAGARTSGSEMRVNEAKLYRDLGHLPNSPYKR